MPCVQAKERQQREAHIRANRRNVDPYDGIDDPLALLKLVHSPPKPDPLIRYLPPPRKPATLYAELDSGQIAAMVRHAHSLLKKGDIHKAQDIAACLLAFVSADISSLLQELIRVEELRPEFLFHRAAPKIRNLLTQHLARVAGHDRLLTDKLLSALAWVGDERVHTFHRATLVSRRPDFYKRYAWKVPETIKPFYPDMHERDDLGNLKYKPVVDFNFSHFLNKFTVG